MKLKLIHSSFRFYVERRHYVGRTRAEDGWSRDHTASIGGAKNITTARKDLAQCKREAPEYFDRRDSFRIVKVTTLSEVVSLKKPRRKRVKPLAMPLVQCPECGARGHTASECPGEDDGS